LEIIFSSPDSATLEANIQLLKKVQSIGKGSDEVLRDAINKVFTANYGGSIERGVTHYSALSIVAASKNSVVRALTSRERGNPIVVKKSRTANNWVHI
jgi:hypothetical protein